MKNNNESAISLLFVSLYIDWNFISYTSTFSSSLLSSINFVPSSERYKLKNRFRGFFCFWFLLWWLFDKTNQTMFLLCIYNIVIMYFRVFKFTVILSIFQCLFILKKKKLECGVIWRHWWRPCTSSRTSNWQSSWYTEKGKVDLQSLILLFYLHVWIIMHSVNIIWRQVKPIWHISWLFV